MMNGDRLLKRRLRNLLIFT